VTVTFLPLVPRPCDYYDGIVAAGNVVHPLLLQHNDHQQVQ
jgi:hypothetical protein